ncbi:hypothetical protein JO84_gp184 [Aureococcus anophagefferens virus]|uniref:Uncharacterized protein n=1 Tax=Aureococcus anophagefferens virus TaxID=1474867 RepID=A0A076FIG6_9VIRU|nr:hypothetical protein JO84_gp184 [Aureococcus anophagefferens virus]AII17251.1 hypothetical protein AaV_291 [Aureococcus anophagefferens virus]UOG94205.1 hypothetical protein MKD35_164 [Aureococcus anophagefferens virus]
MNCNYKNMKTNMNFNLVERTGVTLIEEFRQKKNNRIPIKSSMKILSEKKQNIKTKKYKK